MSVIFRNAMANGRPCIVALSRWCHAGVWKRVFDALTAGPTTDI
jgi:hypothetical protein